ncbi:MAG: TRAP transporter substrate-binding protein [Moorellales bacterium]
MFKTISRCPWPALLLLVFFGLTASVAGGCAKTGPTTSPAPPSNAVSGTPAQPTFTLRFANYFAPESGPGKIGQEFCDDIARITNGRVKVEYYPGGTLLTAPKMYDGVVQGIADIGFSNLAYTFGRFKVTEVLDLPLGFPDAWVANHVVADFYKQFKPKEWEQTYVLTLHSSPVNNIITATKPVRRLEDLKGLTLRGTGYIGTLVEAFGATARPVPMAEAYDNLAKKVIDGLLIPYETTRSFRYGEVTKYVTEIWPLGQVYTFYLVMNRSKWDSLPPDIQEAIIKYVDQEYLEKLAKMWNDIDLAGKQYAIEAGYEIIELPENELARFRQAAEKVIVTYTKNMSAAGYSEAEIKGWIDFVRQRIDYWLEKQKEMGLKSSTGPAEVRAEFKK